MKPTQFVLIVLIQTALTNIFNPSLYDALWLPNYATADKLAPAIQSTRQYLNNVFNEPQYLADLQKGLRFCDEVEQFLGDPVKKAHYDHELAQFAIDHTYEYHKIGNEFAWMFKKKKFSPDLGHLLQQQYASFEDSIITQKPDFLTSGQMKALASLFDSKQRAHLLLAMSVPDIQKHFKNVFYDAVGDLKGTLFIFKTPKSLSLENYGESYVAGGYTDLSWDVEIPQSSPGTFIFTIHRKNTEKNGDEWYALKHKFLGNSKNQDRCAIYSKTDSGPIFCNALFVHYNFENCHNASYFLDTENDYFDISGLPEGQKFIAGTQNFRIENYAVFYIQAEAENQKRILL